MFLDNMDFGFEDRSRGHSLRPHTINNWIPAAIMAGGAVVAALASDSGGGGGTSTPKIRPKTVSGKAQTDFDILYDAEAEEALTNMIDKIGDLAAEDREFFTSVYMPFQEELVQANQTLLPAIEGVAGDALEQMSRNLLSNQSMKTQLSKLQSQFGLDLGEVGTMFRAELDNLPTEEERVGQALAAVESQFGAAGQELAREFASRGQTVSQATRRTLAIEKAKAKAGQAGLAAERARTERLAQLGAGIGIFQGTQAGQTEQILQTQTQDIATGAAAPRMQVGGVDPSIRGTDLTQLQSGLVTTAAQKQVGTRTAQQTIEHTQKGVKGAPQLDENFRLANTGVPVSPLSRNAWEERMRRETMDRRRSGFGGGEGAGGGGSGIGGIGGGSAGGSGGSGGGGLGVV